MLTFMLTLSFAPSFSTSPACALSFSNVPPVFKSTLPPSYLSASPSPFTSINPAFWTLVPVDFAIPALPDCPALSLTDFTFVPPPVNSTVAPPLALNDAPCTSVSLLVLLTFVMPASCRCPANFIPPSAVRSPSVTTSMFPDACTKSGIPFPVKSIRLCTFSFVVSL